MFRIFSAFLFLVIFPIRSHAIVIDIEELLNFPDSDKNLLIIQKFSQIGELQIGGTHTYGNKAVIKAGPNKGRLDPKILIINPDPRAHDESAEVLSIQHSGFDLHLLRNLLTLCQKQNHFFNRIYINNVLPVLPVPDQLPGDLLVGQKKFFEATSFHLKTKDIETSLYHYSKWLESHPNEDLYRLYASLLTQKGRLVSKSAGFARVEVTLLKSLFDTDIARRDIPRCHLEQRMAFLDPELTHFTEELKNSLKKRGDIFPINYLATVKTYPEAPNPESPFYNIQLQTYILEQAGFQIKDLAVKRLHHWNFTLDPLGDSYSLIIIAQKP